MNDLISADELNGILETVLADLRSDHGHLDLSARVTGFGAVLQWEVNAAAITADRRDYIQTIIEHACECFGLFPCSASYVGGVLSVEGSAAGSEVQSC